MEGARAREGPMTEEQVNVELPNVDWANSSSEKAALAVAAGFLLLNLSSWIASAGKTTLILNKLIPI